MEHAPPLGRSMFTHSGIHLVDVGCVAIIATHAQCLFWSFLSWAVWLKPISSQSRPRGCPGPPLELAGLGGRVHLEAETNASLPLGTFQHVAVAGDQHDAGMESPWPSTRRAGHLASPRRPSCGPAP